MKTTLAAVAALMIAVSPAGAQTLTFMDMQNNTEVLGTDFIGTPVNGKDGQLLGKSTISFSTRTAESSLRSLALAVTSASARKLWRCPSRPSNPMWPMVSTSS